MEPTESHHKPSKHHQTSSSDLLSSAKLVAEAAQATFRHDTDKLDKGRVAGAAADLLDAASHYGKLDENKGIGNYMEKAENYLRQYHTSHPTTTATPTTYSGPAHGETRPSPSHGIDYGGEEKKSEGAHGDYLKMAQGFLKSDETKPSSHGSEGSEKKSEGGYGDYMKMAQGFMKSHETKPSSHGSEGGGEKKSEAGFGDYFKMAEGFLKNIIQKARNTLEVLKEVLDAIDSQNPEGAKNEFPLDLVEQCSFQKQRVMHLVLTSRDEKVVSRAILLNEQLQKVLTRDEVLLSGRSTFADKSTMSNGVTSTANNCNHKETEEE